MLRRHERLSPGLPGQCDEKPRACSEHVVPIRHMGAVPIITKAFACMSLMVHSKTKGSTVDMIQLQHVVPTSGKAL